MLLIWGFVCVVLSLTDFVYSKQLFLHEAISLSETPKKQRVTTAARGNNKTKDTGDTPRNERCSCLYTCMHLLTCFTSHTYTCKLFVGYCNGWQSQQPYFNSTLRACFTNHTRIESVFVNIRINITPHFVHCAREWKKHNRCTRGRQPYKCTRRDYLEENHDAGVWWLRTFHAHAHECLVEFSVNTFSVAGVPVNFRNRLACCARI